MRKFNVTGLCVPEEDYMVDISEKIKKIKEMVDARRYFTINRARQYGKTTTLACLEKELKDEYWVASISFEGLGDESFKSEKSFCNAFKRLVGEALSFTDAPEQYQNDWKSAKVATFLDLGNHVAKMCEGKKVVLIIDEVDKVSNNRIFLHFLGMLRIKYMARKNKKSHTFHSVILAGVYDIKNIKLNMAGEGVSGPMLENGKPYNSPWNIAVDFDIDMSFNPAEIATMLIEYESDHKTGMDMVAISESIYGNTNGYPYLVSRVCQKIDETLEANWTQDGVIDAVQGILTEENMLFDDMIKNLENNKALYEFLYNVLIMGEEIAYNTDNPIIKLGQIYGFIMKGEYNKAVVSNKIFEKRIYEYFISKNISSTRSNSGVLKHDIYVDGIFNMELCLRKFAAHYSELWNTQDAAFLEREGRLLFLSYLKPLINGYGFYHIESQFTDLRRMDIIVDIGKNQFILELKIWRGGVRRDKAYTQLASYMSSKGAKTGYLLTFDFRKNKKNAPYAKWAEFEGMKIFDLVL